MQAHPAVSEAEQALVALGNELLARAYRFVTPTPETHRRVVARRARGSDLRDLFGWNLPVADEALPSALRELAECAGAIAREADGWRSRLRFSTIGSRIFAHSAYPTLAADAVFFGPDTYRFARMLEGLGDRRWRRVVDVGCGSGAGGILLAGRADEVVLADINPAALALARANAALAGASNVVTTRSDVLAGVAGDIDLVIANPPYLADDLGRAYRDGGGELGTGLACRIVDEALERLAPGGELALYTGTPIVGGRDVFRDAVSESLGRSAAEVSYRELDPDVFGEELERPAYHGCERIAVVELRVRLPAVQR